jgi:hypothetical protein
MMNRMLFFFFLSDSDFLDCPLLPFLVNKTTLILMQRMMQLIMTAERGEKHVLQFSFEFLSLLSA